MRTLAGAATGLAGPFYIGLTSSGRRDLNGDARADILWRHTSDTLALWFMNGAAVLGTSLLGSVGTDWTIVDVGG